MLTDPQANHWRGIVGGRGLTVEEFKSYVDGVTLSTWKPQFVVLHNTQQPTLEQWHASDPYVRVNENLVHEYRDLQHWNAGPHVFVADDLIWLFTPLWMQGTHSPSWNAVSWGVEMVGDYSVEPFNQQVQDNTASVLAALHSKLSLDPRSLRLHREDPKTTHRCPGDNVHKDDMIATVQAILMPPSQTIAV